MGKGGATSLKLAPALLERAEALVEWVATQPDLAPTGRGTRADVLRAAVALGLAELDRRRSKDAR